MNPLLKLLPRPSPDAFAKRVSRYLERRGIARESIHYDREEFSLQIEGRERIFLVNAYEQASRLWPWQRRALPARYFGQLPSFDESPEQAPQSFEEISPRLLPGVRHVAYYDAVRLGGYGPEAPGPFIRLGEHLVVGLFIDEPQRIRAVGDSDLKNWGVSAEAAIERAKTNLAARSTLPLERLGEGVYASNWHDFFDTARILLDDKLQGLDVKGDVVAHMPSWQCLIVTGSEPDQLLVGLTLTQKAAEEEGRSTSLVPLVRRGATWETLELPRGHPCEPLLRDLRVRDLVAVYEDQKNALDRIHEKEGLDIYVAQYNGVRSREGEVSSYCCWTKGVTALLPRTDDVVFIDPERPRDDAAVGKFAWDVVWHHCHEMMQPADHLLRRCRVDTFPGPEQIEVMRVHQQTREVTAS